MRIRTKTKLSALITVSLVLFLGLFIYLTEQRVANSAQKEILSGEIIDGVFDLSILTQDYLLYKEERAKEQWILSYNKIGPSFDSKLFNTQEEIEIVEDLIQSYTELDSIFSKLTNPTISKELEDRLTSQLLIKLDRLVFSSFKLASINQAQLTKAISFDILIQSVVLLLIIVTLLNAYLTLKISSPLAKLTKGTEIVGKGNLKYRIDVKSKDEIGQLAAAFNEMGSKLKRSYEGLEEKVRQRTKDLAEAKAKDEAVLASIGDGVLVTNKNGIVLMVNAAGEGITGFSDKEIVGHHYSKLKFIREKDKSPVKDFIKEAITSGKITGMENHVLLVRKDKKEIAVADSAAPVKDANNKTIGAVVVFRDITKEREIDHMKDEFLNIAAHELRTPLTAIRWNTSLIMQSFRESLKDEKVKGMIDDMHASSLRLTEIVNDFLDVSRLEAGRIDFRKEAIDLKGLVKKSLEGIKIVADKKGLYLKFEEPKEALPKVLVDKDRLEQILVNLLGNAIKFTEKGGVGVEVAKEGGLLKVRVKDTGVGIAKDTQKLLFQKFQQSAEGSYTRDATKGTGLGLYISKLLVEGMGGKIYLEKSEPNKGSIFAFTLPVSKATSSAPSHQASTK